MNREKLQHNPIPIDRVAARVVAPGVWWEPGRWKNEPTFDVQPLLQPIGAERLLKEGFVDHTGEKRGALTILGLGAKQGNGGKVLHRWVARCSCGLYVYRKGAALKKPCHQDSCPRCTAKIKIRNQFKG